MGVVGYITSFKAFEDCHDVGGQSAAIVSWKESQFKPVVIAGKEAGVKKVCDENGFVFEPSVERARDRNLQSGHPMLRSLIEVGLSHTKTPYLCLINSDIIVAPRFQTTLCSILLDHPSSCVTGNRYDISPIATPVMSVMDCALLFDRPRQKHVGGGTDFFVLTRTLWKRILKVMPDYVFGATAWDNWLHGAMLRFAKYPINATSRLLVLHASHLYIGLNGQKNRNGFANHPAVQHNQRLYRSSSRKGSLTNAKWVKV